VSLSPDINKALPHDGLAERAILGAMLIDNRYTSEVFSKIKAMFLPVRRGCS